MMGVGGRILVDAGMALEAVPVAGGIVLELITAPRGALVRRRMFGMHHMATETGHAIAARGVLVAGRFHHAGVFAAGDAEHAVGPEPLLLVFGHA